MARQSIRIVLVLTILTLFGVGFIQWFWLDKAFDIKARAFNESVKIALTGTAERIVNYNNSLKKRGSKSVRLKDPVNQLTDNYFVVRVDGEIDANLLEILLKEELSRVSLYYEYEYGIYDCANDKMVYGNYIATDPGSKLSARNDLPKWENHNYYFGVRFPSRDSTLISQMGIWLFSSGVLIFVLVFMIIAIIMILRQKRLSEIQKDFINNMTHEFKTPISSILISAETIKKELTELDFLTPKSERYLEVIHNGAKRLQKQVEAVLKMADLDSIKLKLERLDIRELIGREVDTAELAINRKGGDLKFEFPSEPIEIEADALHVSNVISNLLDNAMKYNENAPKIQVSLSLLNPAVIQISISDNGIGIGKEQLKRIFDKFYRVPTGNIHNVKGFGLGLFYVKSVVRAHKGQITAQSEIGKGTTIILTLPVQPK